MDHVEHGFLSICTVDPVYIAMTANCTNHIRDLLQMSEEKVGWQVNFFQQSHLTFFLLKFLF